MWIKIFELPNGDIESVELYWDKKVCEESCFVEEEGIDDKGYVGDKYLGQWRIIEIKEEKVNDMLMYLLHNYIVNCDSKYVDSLICGKTIEEWLRYLGV